MSNRKEMVEFIEGKLIDAFAALKAREEMETVWRGGTDESWRAVGCTRTKAQRLKDSEMHGRIAVKLRHEVNMFKAVKDALSLLGHLNSLSFNNKPDQDHALHRERSKIRQTQAHT
jgi:hypothetical protein